MSSNRFFFTKQGLVIVGAALGIGLILGMFIHAFTYTTMPGKALAGSQTALSPGKSGRVDRTLPEPALDFPSSQQFVEAVLQSEKSAPIENRPWDIISVQVRGILHQPITSHQKVAALMNLAKTMPVDQRSLAYEGAVYACESRDFQEWMLPLIWDPATLPDQAQILAGGVVGLPDSVRLPICLTFLSHPAEEVRATGLAVLSSYFPDAEEASYPAAVQAYLANPD